jgi:Ca2+-binding EF-hand superfamily protein
MKVFDHNNDGQISMEEFYNTLAQEFWAPTIRREVTLAHTSAAHMWASINST